MLRVVKVLGRVLVLGRVATGGMATNKTHAQVNPRIACLNAVLTHMRIRLSDFDLIKVRAFFWHRFLRMLASKERRAKSFGDEQALRKGPLLINPLCLAAETGIARHLEDLIGRVLVAALRPDGLTL